MDTPALRSTAWAVAVALGVTIAIYFSLLSAMIVAPSLQAHAIYLHKITLTWFRDLNVPEQFGFAHHQATPFYISAEDGERLHCWHVLPIGAYAANQNELLAQGPEGGLVERYEETLNFKLLKENPNARLVLYFHGTSGTMASGWRPDSYRSIYAVDPVNTHILTFDYRGYGKSTGHPSEPGLIRDAEAITNWALHTAGIPPSRIVIFGQSLGSAVAIALVHKLAVTRKGDDEHRSVGAVAEARPGGGAILFSGLVVTASFTDVAALTATYRLGGTVPVLSPVARTIPPLFRFFTRRLHHTWDNARRLAEFVEVADRYDITLLHAEDDTDIPVEHSVRLFTKAVGGAEGSPLHADGSGDQRVLSRITECRQSHGEGGSITTWSTRKGVIRLQLLKYGVHDKIMSYSATSLAIDRAFQSSGHID